MGMDCWDAFVYMCEYGKSAVRKEIETNGET